MILPAEKALKSMNFRLNSLPLVLLTKEGPSQPSPATAAETSTFLGMLPVTYVNVTGNLR